MIRAHSDFHHWPAYVFVILAIVLVFEVAMFVHVFKNKRIDDNARMWWMIGMILLHPIVAIFYCFTDYKKNV